ncbi:ribosome small subunit-dependent GTPase A [Candidatus Gracilibacteria bacterium GN02-873]|nr:ribosome small subunit-dependent GTPase A [Candidatus Gracilibacteria bacterium GN02-873]
MSKFNEFGQKINIFEKRTQNKKYLTKKKQYHEKHHQEYTKENEIIFSENNNENIGQISQIKQSFQGKIFYVIVNSEVFQKNVKNKNISNEITIGDFVEFQDENITNIRQRKNLLARYKGDSDRFSLHKRILQPIAANLDFVVIVASAMNPKFQPGFIERYIILAESCNIPILICISKSDLQIIKNPILEYYTEQLGIPIVYTSSETGQGIEELKEKIFGKNVVFVGKSGVGKSSLINTILQNHVTKTSSVSEKGGQGRHTTVSSKMHIWDENSYIIDTPGIRSLDFLEFSKEELPGYFSDFSDFMSGCQFADCSHTHEKICGIKEAVKLGQIPKERYNAYIRLFEEII